MDKAFGTGLAILWLALAGGPVLSADTVSATPGKFKGVIHFHAPFVPAAMTVDARDATNNYTAHADAAQNDPVNCAPNSENWCYQITVESALASSYYLRPIAYLAAPAYYTMPRAPFPPAGPVGITAGATVSQDISYTPGEVSGTVTASDMAGQPLALATLYFSVNDNSNTFPEPCGGSINFCPYNSVFTPSGPPIGPYQLYLKPGDDYTYINKSFSIGEPGARSDVAFNGGEHLGSVIAGQSLIRDYALQQKASVTGTLSQALPVYNDAVTVSGTTTAGLGFSDTYRTYNSGQPLASPTYISRIFDFADFTKPFALQPSLALSADGQTNLSYPPVLFNLALGEQKTLNFSGSSATINGRVTFDPPYMTLGPGPGYASLQAEMVSSTGGLGSASTPLKGDAQGGTYSLPVFGANWNYWRFSWYFDLGNPNFTAYYTIGQFLTIPVPVADGQTVQQNFNFDTALLKVYFSAPAGTTISDPHLDAISGKMSNGLFVADGDFAHGEGLNQSKVTTGEARMVLRVHDGASFRITPSAVINTDPTATGTSRTDFSPMVITPNKGDVTVVGVPGSLSLTVTSPKEGDVIQGCLVPVAGTATGAQNISITVNGQPVTAVPAGNSADPNQVSFTANIAGSNGTITVTASAPSNTPVTAVIHVTGSGGAPAMTAKAGTPILWPPNHDLINVGLAVTSSSACDPNPSVGVKVFSNESDTDDTGTGNFSPDARDMAPKTLRLRAERDATGNGRVYLIVASGTDTAGNAGYACAAVVVPHDYNANSVANVNAQASAAITGCQGTGAPPSGYVQVGTGPVMGPKQ